MRRAEAASRTTSSTSSRDDDYGRCARTGHAQRRQPALERHRHRHPYALAERPDRRRRTRSSHAGQRHGDVLQNTQSSMIDTATGTFASDRPARRGRPGCGARSWDVPARQLPELHLLHGPRDAGPGAVRDRRQGRPTRENQRAGTPKPPQRDVVQWGTRRARRLTGTRVAARSRRSTAIRRTRASSRPRTSGSPSALVRRDQLHRPSSPRRANSAPTSVDLDVVNGPLPHNGRAAAVRIPRGSGAARRTRSRSRPGPQPDLERAARTVGWRANCSSSART